MNSSLAFLYGGPETGYYFQATLKAEYSWHARSLVSVRPDIDRTEGYFGDAARSPFLRLSRQKRRAATHMYG